MVSRQDSVVVYRSTDPVALDLVEDMLRVEGLSPQRLGRASPALLGVGIAAIEQLIAVPHACVDSAQALIAARAQLPGPEAIADLEEQALNARPIPAEGNVPDGLLIDFRILVAVALVLLAAAIILRF